MGLWRIGLEIGKFLIPGKKVASAGLGTSIISTLMNNLDASQESADLDFVCKYAEEINTATLEFSRHVDAAVFDAHWSAFSYGSRKSFENARDNRAQVESSTGDGVITAPKLYTINYNRKFAEDSAGDALEMPPGRSPGSLSRERQGYETQRLRPHLSTDPIEDRGALWDGGTLVVSRPPRGGTDRSPAEDQARMTDQEWQAYLDRVSTPVEGEVSLERSASSLDPYYQTSPSWTESAKRQSREEFARKLYGPSILNGECSHMDARVFEVLSGIIEAVFQSEAAATYGNRYPIFGGSQSGSNNQLAIISRSISEAGWNSDGTGVSNIVYDTNRLTASALPIVSSGTTVGRHLWNATFDVADFFLLDLVPDSIIMDDPCGKPPCDS